MLRTTSGLSRPVLKWVSQVTASLGATLAATLIWSAVPHPGALPALQPELTSGGKFAARVIEPVAYDGLDTMPLPHVAPPPAQFVAAAESAPAAVLRRTAWEETAPAAAVPDRSLRAARAVRPPVRIEARRAEPATRSVIVPAPVTITAASEHVPEATADEGILHRVIPSSLPHILPTLVSTARTAWSVTASAGDTLVSHVVPQLP